MSKNIDSLAFSFISITETLTSLTRTGLLSLSWLETNKLVQNCFVRLSNWRLEVWQTTSHFRRGDEPWMSIVLGSGSLIRQDGDRFCVENADQAEMGTS